MPIYMIQRSFPGAGNLGSEDLRQIARQSNAVVREMGSDYAWIQSYLSDDGITCIHRAPDEAAVREHSRRGGFPCDSVTEIRSSLDPSASG